jgi:N utilization substance protein A
MNARLAARLTGWRIDIKSESTFALEESASEYGGGEGELQRCAALLRNGKRCVNAAVPGTRYCSLPAHARLAEMESQGIDIAPDQAVGAVVPAQADAPADAVAATGGANGAVEPGTAGAAAAERADEHEPADDQTQAASPEPPVEVAAESEEEQS